MTAKSSSADAPKVGPNPLGDPWNERRSLAADIKTTVLVAVFLAAVAAIATAEWLWVSNLS